MKVRKGINRMLYIMRHGKTDWNEQHKLQGRTDIPLNENGIAMAKKPLPAKNILRWQKKQQKNIEIYIWIYAIVHHLKEQNRQPG